MEVGQRRTQSGEAFHDKQYLSFGGGAVFLDCDSRRAAMAKYSKEQHRDWLEEQRTGTRRCVEAVRLMLLY